MWHYPEGVENHSPLWESHGVRALPGPTPLWLDARGARLPAPLFPGFDTLGTVAHLGQQGFDHSWLVMNARVAAREFALAGSEHNPEITENSVLKVIGRLRGGTPASVKAFLARGRDFVVEARLDDLVRRMNRLAGAEMVDPAGLRAAITARDDDLVRAAPKDPQILAISKARTFLGERLARVARPRPLLEHDSGPLVAVRLWTITRKTLGGLHTDLACRVLDECGSPVPGLYAAGEAAGFGGGGMHGYRALEGTFLGGCLFSGRSAGRAMAASVG
jgi:predicted oxidoreductase